MPAFHFHPISFAKKKAPSLPLISENNAPFQYTEAYKSLRTSLKFISEKEQAHSFVVASAIPDENASSTALNLAISLANDSKRVIIVDCDLRRPSLQNILSADANAAGLVHVLTGKKQLENVIYKCDNLNLSVLPAGETPANPSELLDQPQMKDVIQTLKAQFDYVILTAPPVSILTDATIVGQYVDGALLVVRSKFAPREDVQLAKHKLESVHIPIFGVILTQFNTRKTNKTSGYAHMHRYQY